MKKILTAMVLVAGTAFLQAQGYIQFNGSVAAISTNTSSYYAQGSGTPVFGKTTGSGTAPGTMTYALLYGGSGTASSGNWTQVSQYITDTLLLGNNGSSPGGLTGPGTTSGVQVNNAAGVAVSVILVGWSSNLGSTWASIASQLGNGTLGGANWSGTGYFGQTAIGSMTPFATLGAGDPAIFPTMFANGSLTLYAVTGVPEPATIALAGLGGLALLALRRKK